MSKIIQFGEEVEGYNILVLNEREIRAAAGILFFATFTSLMYIMFKGNFLAFKYVVTFFFFDFLIRVFINPKYAPTLILGRLIVSNQNPEYVGAKQKKFAWIIGVVLSGIMFIFFIIVNAFSPITGIICLICLIFLFFETAFGICLGCLVFKLFNKEKVQYCPGEICDKNAKQEIQKTSAVQLLIVLLFVGFIIATVILFNENFKVKPYDLFGIFSTTKTK